MANERECPRCGQRTAATDAADTCTHCGAPLDWREPRAADVIDDDDEKVVEDVAAVETPGED